MLASVLGSFGTAGVPGTAVIMATVVLSAAGLPLEGIGYLYAIDRILDMMRTMTNVTGQMLVPVLVAKETGLLDREVYEAAPATSALPKAKRRKCGRRRDKPQGDARASRAVSFRAARWSRSVQALRTGAQWPKKTSSWSNGFPMSATTAGCARWRACRPRRSRPRARALPNTLYGVSLQHEGEVIGMGPDHRRRRLFLSPWSTSRWRRRSRDVAWASGS